MQVFRRPLTWWFVGLVGVLASWLATPSSTDAIAVSVLVVVAALSLGLTSSLRRESRPVLHRFCVSVLAVDAVLFTSFFLSPTTNFNLAIGAAMAITLVGLSFLTGVSGQISLGNGAFMGVGAFSMAIWANHHATTPIVVTLVISVAAGAAVGLLLGIPATRLRGPYLAGMTLAFAVAFGAILNYFGSWTGGDGGLQLPSAATPPSWLRHLFDHGAPSLTTNTLWITDIAVVVTGVAFFFMANLFNSRIGRAMRLVRDNEVAAELVGVSLGRTRVLAFTVSSAYAALGGAVWTFVDGSVSPSTYSFALSIIVLSIMVIGGIGTISGALIGGLIYAYSTNVIAWITTQTGLNPQGNVASQLNGVIFGALLMVTMMFAPRGIAGALHGLSRRRHSRRGDLVSTAAGAYAEANEVSTQ